MPGVVAEAQREQPVCRDRHRARPRGAESELAREPVDLARARRRARRMMSRERSTSMPPRSVRVDAVQPVAAADAVQRDDGPEQRRSADAAHESAPVRSSSTGIGITRRSAHVAKALPDVGGQPRSSGKASTAARTSPAGERDAGRRDAARRSGARARRRPRAGTRRGRLAGRGRTRRRPPPPCRAAARRRRRGTSRRRRSPRAKPALKAAFWPRLSQQHRADAVAVARR